MFNGPGIEAERGNKTRADDCMTPTVWNRAVSGPEMI